MPPAFSALLSINGTTQARIAELRIVPKTMPFSRLFSESDDIMRFAPESLYSVSSVDVLT
jgi:hypothetical protein